MDVTTTLLTVVSVYVIVKYLNSLVPTGLPSLIKVPLALLIGIGVVCLFGISDFAPGLAFFGVPLETMNGATQALVGGILGLGATGLDTTFKTIRNVGQNDVTT